MAKERTAFTSPVGRMVQGDCFVAQTKDQQGNLRVVKSGPNVGQPAPQFFVALAIPKLVNGIPNPEWPGFFNLLYTAAVRDWPTLFPATTAVGNVFGVGLRPCVNPTFTFKVKDGDALDRNGKNNADKEGFAGHWIVSFASSYAPKVSRPTAPGSWERLTDPNSVKRGYYLRIAGSAAGNDSPNTPGIYCNVDLIELVGYGEEIVGGPDESSAFAAPAALPAGASAMPIATGAVGGAAPPPPGAAAAPPPPAAAAPPPPAAAAPPPPAAAAAPPPPAAAAPPPPAAAAGPTMLPAAGATTYAAYIAAGWTDETLVANGMMAAPDPAFLAAAPPPATGAAPPPPPASAPVATGSPIRIMTPAANGATYESMIAAGWSDEQMIAGGMMTVA